jgi:hypothetical protein
MKNARTDHESPAFYTVQQSIYLKSNNKRKARQRLIYRCIRGVVMSTHAEDLKLRLMTIELLRTAKYKRNITYRELGSKTGLPVTVLSRYAKGHKTRGFRT